MLWHSPTYYTTRAEAILGYNQFVKPSGNIFFLTSPFLWQS